MKLSHLASAVVPERKITHRHRAPIAKAMSAIQELDAIEDTVDLPAHGLKRGDVGTAVLVHDRGRAFEVEFVGYGEHTVALLTLENVQVRPLRANDVPHTPAVASA